jgi:hypothetical protein
LKTETLAVTAVIIIIMASIALTGFQVVYAQVLDRDVEAPTFGLNDTASTQSPNVSIDISPLEPLPINGTVMMSLEDVDDTNMNEIPPQGVTVIITNESVTVTNQEIIIEETETGEPAPSQVVGPFSPAIPAEPPTEEEDNSNSGSGNDDDDEGSEDGDDDDGDDGIVVGDDDDEDDEG